MSTSAVSWKPDALRARLDEVRRRHGVVGASLAVLIDGEVSTAASGLLNLDTGVEATPDSVFQIGSIGKLFTATLLMQLVDEGMVELDAPVRRYLPDFAIADASASAAITVRQLLAHTSGIDGDYLPPDDPAGPSSENYVRRMRALALLHPVGAYMSYCNSGYVAAGRIVEVLRGKSWAQLVMDRICRPLAMTQAYADPRESLRYRCAIGHVADPADRARSRVSPLTYLPLSIAAAGSVLSMSATDLLRFARAQLADGDAGNGRRILSAESARAMRRPQIELLPYSRKGYSHMGLGWFLAGRGRNTLIGHDGTTAGQMAYLHLLPERGLAFALLTNSPSAPLADELRSAFFADLASLPPVQDPPPQPVDCDAARYVGVYENVATRIELQWRDGALHAQALPRVPGGSALSASLRPHSRDCFELQAEDPAVAGKITFWGKGARAEYLRLGVRMARRVHEESRR
ncbi:MAG: serine hydrolase domain-containing protein [Sinimarinibacterium flocculans]|uniref:serine hydrolase domain-containing protein n=1 Tax=Sinimarinibacterium flocculans TaxID=985250 RepID=UPI003C360C9C